MGERVAVIGAGYVGLTTAACLAHMGHEVVCADIDEERIAQLNAGETPIFEQGLESLLREGRANGRLTFVLGAANAAATATICFLCVPTPQSADGAADLQYLEVAARQIAPVLGADSIVVNKSTVPIGSTRVVAAWLERADVSVVSNPEFLREGTAVHDFLHPDRVVVGADDPAAARRVADLYQTLDTNTIVCDAASAEMIKYAANAYLAMKLSFVNSVAALCEHVGADCSPVVEGLGSDHRIGPHYLQPGPGWGGSCFPKDTLALDWMAREVDYRFDLLQTTVEVNEQQFDRTVAKAEAFAGGSLAGQQVAVWGLAFKADTDDYRESPALHIVQRLLDVEAKVRAYDPEVRSLPFEGVDVVADPYEAVENARVLLLITEWDEFRWLDFDRIHRLMATPHIVDGRNLLDRDQLRSIGFQYRGVGR
ncbi:MAG: UDP-glucose/GDP-mannose dehydrogenase family protein [Acidimicrobiia bacterium]|nr:UDP-glucose/GDP-mannose dehydrogenase family protein [Acidimicrobiia bacterium]